MFARVVRRFVLSLSLTLALAVVLTGAPAKAVPVGVKLVLLADVSGSVDPSEYKLQKQGYIDAFRDPAIQAAIAGIPGGIVVAYGEWSSFARKVVDWTHITDAASANAFAAALAARPRSGYGATAPGAAIYWAYNMLRVVDGSYQGGRKVIDIGGDGRQNYGANTLLAARQVHAQGITINGLPILGEPGLQQWYQDNIVTPGGGFLQVANGFSDFTNAVKAKIAREIRVVPEPATLALFGIGLLGLGVLRRRRAVS